MNFFSGNFLWHLILQSDAISSLVLLILLGMSVVSWTIFIAKLIIFFIKKKQLHHMNKHLRSIKTAQELISFVNTTPKNSVPHYFLIKNIAFLQEISKSTVSTQINEKDWLLIEKNCDVVLESMILHDEAYTPFLSSSAAVAPLLGLFGTVWGLIHAFMRISETQVADIATIAPGIAEALITTLAGLIVAIPALIMYNYLQTKSRFIEHQLFLLADRMLFILQQLRETRL